MHPDRPWFLWAGGGAGEPWRRADAGICQRRPRAGAAGRSTGDPRGDRRRKHPLCGRRGARCQLWLRGGAGAAGDQPDHPGKKDRGHHRALRQRQKHPAAAANALLGRADRQHPVRGCGHPAGEHRRPARARKSCDAGDRTVCGYHRQQHPHRKARCHAGRGGSRLQKGCAG